MFKYFLRPFSYSGRCASTHARHVVRPISPVNETLKYNVGDKIFGYIVKQVDEVPELQLAAVRLCHEKTGADHLHVARDDKNNFFSVALRTPPKDSTGVTHVLEHLSLCGSQRFPCRDPFFKMRNRSLATFMNAYTGSDFTMYPFSSQNAKDFDNLLEVYLDAVFFPQLRERDFWQEGWRIEHSDVHDKNSPIIFKGVVFNEMKGVYSDASQCYARSLLNKLFPSDTYSHDSGGNPLKIPNLSWTELKRFHSEHYHPSNSRFFTYGDLPLENHLEYIENYVLKKFSKISINNTIEEEVPWTKQREEYIHCRFDPMAAVPEKQTTVSISYLLNNITETHEAFALSILGMLLSDGPNAPFYKTLMEPGIGSDYSPWTGYEGQLKQSFFSIGLREILETDVDLVKNIINSTFSSIVKDGFPKERIDGVLHYIELCSKHQSTSFGHSTALGINSIWNHGGNPIDALKINDHVQWFQKQMKENPYFLQEKVDCYFRQNHHRLSLIMMPDMEYERKLQLEEQQVLLTKLSSLNDEQEANVFTQGMELLKCQEAAEDLSCLPALQISDVQKQIDFTNLQYETVGNVPVQVCESPTNGVTYFNAFARVDGLSEDLLMLLPLFSAVVTKMGAGDRDYKQLDQDAELKTGGLSAAVQVTEHPSSPDIFELGVLFSSHSLDKNVGDMMSLWTDIFNCLTLHDRDRLSQLIKMTAADLSQSIPYSGHKYSITKASSSLNLGWSIREKMSGLAQVSFMKMLAEMENFDDIIMKLQVLSHFILNSEKLRCSVNANSDSILSSFSAIESFIKSLNKKATSGSPLFSETFKAEKNKIHFILPYAVSYVGKSLLTVPYNHEDFASLKIAAQLLSFKYLHTEIREKGGAYGGGAALSKGGALQFYSYRDPNVLQTLKSFDAGIQWLINGEYTLQDIDAAKLGVFSEVDHPVAPGAKGSSQFLYGITDDMKQKLRENLFQVKKDEIISVAKRYLTDSKLYGVALIGPEHEMTKNSTEWSLHCE